MIGPKTRAAVRERAQNACEYCHLHEDESPLAALHIEHIIPKTHGGDDDLDNLALACIDCNLHKGTNLTGIDPQTNNLTELFHPRRQLWDEHFGLQGVYLVGKTAAGRTTIRVLSMNSEDQLALRSSRQNLIAPLLQFVLTETIFQGAYSGLYAFVRFRGRDWQDGTSKSTIRLLNKCLNSQTSPFTSKRSKREFAATS